MSHRRPAVLRRCSLAVLLLLTASYSAASHAAPGGPGVTEGRRGGPAQRELEGEDLSELLEELRAPTEVPGLVAMAVQDGEIVAWAAAGVRAAGSETPMTIHDSIHLGSCSKAMTSTLAGRLVEEGLLEWGSTIGQVLPEFAKGIDQGYHGVTLEDLLQHRGGIAERRRPEISSLHETLERLEGSPRETRKEILTLVLESAPLAPPPNGNDYSNFGYMTAGLMMENVTNKSFEELIVTRLFEPLGMASAGVGSPQGEGVPVGHDRKDGGWIALPPGPEGRLHHAMTPAGLLHCNLQDWSSFLLQHVRGEQGEDGLVSAECFQRLHRDPGSGYGAGWGLGRHRWSFGEAPKMMHNGSDGTWYSRCMILPEWDLVVMSAANAGSSAGEEATRRAEELMLRSAGFMD